MSPERKCEECIFWDFIPKSDGFGECRRHAPVPRFEAQHIASARLARIVDGPIENLINPGDSSQWALWPVTAGESWCGEYVGKQAKQTGGLKIDLRNDLLTEDV